MNASGAVPPKVTGDATGRHAPFFFVEPGALPGPASGAGEGPPLVVIQGPDARHLAVVRRAVPGQAVTLSDGRGRVLEARLRSVAPARVEAEVMAEVTVAEPLPKIDVFQALAKGEKVDTVIRQLVEVGVDSVTVFEAGRSVARWDAARAAAAGARWTAVAHEAAKQSHRAWLPSVSGPASLDQAVASAARGGAGLVGHPTAAATLRDALEQWGRAGAWPGRLWLVIGPEGGLSDGEVSAFVSAGGMEVSFGRQILRTETASIVLASVLLYATARFGA